MKNRNLFIVDDSLTVAKDLQKSLEDKFGDSLTISTFSDGDSVLKNINSNTEFVILDYDLKGDKGQELFEAIKKINTQTEVIILSTNKDILTALDSFQKGANNYIVKGEKAPRKIFLILHKIINYPVKILVERFSVNKILAIFITYFFFVGLIVYLGMTFIT